jgi:DNA-binding transcriptional LysR family regulator
VKELEGYFGVPLTRRIGRRIEVTTEGKSLARLIRQHFAGLDDFREAMSGRPVAARLGAAASVLEWMVMPKFAECREAVGDVILELEQLRTADVVRAVSDGRRDFGVVREDAAPSGMKRLKLGKIGFGLFAPVEPKGSSPPRNSARCFPAEHSIAPMSHFLPRRSGGLG